MRRGYAYPHGRYLKKHTPEHALTLADGFATDAEALLPAGKRVTFLEGYSGALAMGAVIAAARGDAAASSERVQVHARARGGAAACRRTVRPRSRRQASCFLGSS